MKFSFEKYSAQGNDFIIIDNRDNLFPENNTKLIAALCQRRLSIGADGLILLDKLKGDFRTKFYNSDGKPGDVCGNGARASVDYAEKLGIIKNNTLFYVWDSEHKAIIRDHEIGVELNIPDKKIIEKLFEKDENKYTSYLCNTGVNHLIIFDDFLSKNLQYETARFLRYHKNCGTGGANVNFIKVTDRHNITHLTYEKGVEDYTYACGTGAVAAACVCSELQKTDFPVNVHVRGGVLKIEKAETDNKLWLYGEVVNVYSGIVGDELIRTLEV